MSTARNAYSESCKVFMHDWLSKQKTLLFYLRNKKGERVGLVIASRDPQSNELQLGWSKCNTKMEHFDKYIAFKKAAARLTPHDNISLFGLPNSIAHHMAEIYQRAVRYWKLRENTNSGV